MSNRLIEYASSQLRWEAEAVELGIRANFSCEYCHKCLIDSVDNHYDWNRDHIKPTKLGGTDDFDNLALSCRQCNFLKRGTWSEDLELRGRKERIKYFQKELQTKRKRKQRELEGLVQAINEYT